jgi:hypothetical protein
MAQEGSSLKRGLWIGAAVLVVGLAIVWSRLEPGSPDSPAPSPSESAGAPAPAPAPAGGARLDPPPRLASPRPGPLRLESGDVVAIERADLTGDAPVAIELLLPTGVAVKSGRIVTPGAGSVRLDDELAGQSDTVSLSLPVEQLRTPGRYLLEVRTDERTPLPLRRFAIEVR